MKRIISVPTRMRKTVLLLASVATALLLASEAALAAPGDLDTSFDQDGSVFTDFTPASDPSWDEAREVIVQADGKIVAAGFSEVYPDESGDNSGFALARYDADGSLDASFGEDGKVVTDVLSSISWERVDALAVQPDGKILAGGGEGYYGDPNGGSILVRYNTDGTLDTSFDSDGIASLDLHGQLSGLAIQDDGKIVAAGGLNHSDYQVVRLNTDGTPDPTFGGAGKVQTTFGSESTQAYIPHDVAIQDDGKIIVSGACSCYGQYGPETLGLIRFNTDGSLDNSFGRWGKVHVYITDWDVAATSLAVQPDGKIVASGVGAGFVLVRFNADSSLDTSFGTEGKIHDGQSPGAWDIALQSDGKILGAIGGPWGTSSSPPLVRYNADGTRDTALQTTSTLGDASYYALALQSDGKPVLAGYRYSESTSSSDLALSRYLGSSDDPPETTIDLGPPDYVSSTTASFSFSSSEPGSTFECSRDGSTFAACTSPKSYSSLSQGNHTFKVRATSSPGNTDVTPAIRSWFVDTVVPKGTITINGKDASTSSRSVTLYLSALDPSNPCTNCSGVGSVRFRNEFTTWSEWRDYSWSHSWLLSEGAGTKTVYTQFKDRAGNVSATASDKIRFRP